MDKKWYGDGQKLGVLGGGQLGRMLIQAAINYDVQIYVMDTSRASPSGHLAYEFTEGDIQSYDDVMAFGKNMDIITVEIEHVNANALEELEKQGIKVFPQPKSLRLIQDKGLQKTFYKEHNIPTAPFQLVDKKSGIQNLKNEYPFIQKLRKGGYDGKGVKVIHSEQELSEAFDVPSLVEEKINFKKELSVIVARNEQGEVRSFPVVECEFNEQLNLVEFLFSPADISEAVEEKATVLAKKIIQELDLVGLLAVELFLTQEDDILVNEVAPRTHNSGHHTIECNKVSQFEQHLRAILGLPLGDTGTKTPGVMINLIGEKHYEGIAKYDGLEEVMRMKEVYVHLYGKQNTRPGRKMGHVTITNSDLEEAKMNARKVQEKLKVVSF